MPSLSRVKGGVKDKGKGYTAGGRFGEEKTVSLHLRRLSTSASSEMLYLILARCMVQLERADEDAQRSIFAEIKACI